MVYFSNRPHDDTIEDSAGRQWVLRFRNELQKLDCITKSYSVPEEFPLLVTIDVARHAAAISRATNTSRERFDCIVRASSPRVRGVGFTERVGDVNLQISFGSPSRNDELFDLTLVLNTNVTNRIDERGDPKT